MRHNKKRRGTQLPSLSLTARPHKLILSPPVLCFPAAGLIIPETRRRDVALADSSLPLLHRRSGLILFPDPPAPSSANPSAHPVAAGPDPAPAFGPPKAADTANVLLPPRTGRGHRAGIGSLPVVLHHLDRALLVGAELLVPLARAPLPQPGLSVAIAIALLGREMVGHDELRVEVPVPVLYARPGPDLALPAGSSAVRRIVGHFPVRAEILLAIFLAVGHAHGAIRSAGGGRSFFADDVVLEQ